MGFLTESIAVKDDPLAGVFEDSSENEKTLEITRKTRVSHSRGDRIRTYDPLVPNELGKNLGFTLFPGKNAFPARFPCSLSCIVSHCFASYFGRYRTKTVNTGANFDVFFTSQNQTRVVSSAPYWLPTIRNIPAQSAE